MYFSAWVVGSCIFLVGFTETAPSPTGNTVWGVFRAEPEPLLPEGSAWAFVGVLRLEKVANAPVPSPKADEADVDGDGREVTSGVTLLKGLPGRLLCELVSPPRGLLKVDGWLKTFDGGASLVDMDSESLLLL